MNKKIIDRLLGFGNSHIIELPANIQRSKGVTKFQVFLSIKPILTGKLYWYALKQAYTQSDNLYYYSYDIKQAFSSQEPHRETMMNQCEQKYLQGLPNEITIYRAMTVNEFESGVFGVSWTLKKNIADFFSSTYVRNIDTYGIKKTIVEKTISKDQIIAFFNDRDEFEIIHITGDFKTFTEGLRSNNTKPLT